MQSITEPQEKCLFGLAEAIRNGNLNEAVENLVEIVRTNIRVKIELADGNQNIRNNMYVEQTDSREMDVLEFWEKNQEEILIKNKCSLT